MATVRTRRNLMYSVTGAAGLLLAGEALSKVAAQTPQPIASPNAPLNQNAPGGLDSPPAAKPTESPYKINQKQIAAAVEEIYKLASELKTEVESTNLTNTMPLDFIRKAQQIEKLAKLVKDRAKG